MHRQIYLLTIITFFAGTQYIWAQFGLTGGINGFTVKNHSLTGEISPKVNIHFGFSWETKILKSSEKLFFRAECVLASKGYRQRIGQETFSQNFTYFGLWPNIQYRLSEVVAAHTGVELNGLLGTSSENGTSVYKGFECAAFVGIDLFPKKQFSYFIRTSIGLTPVLDYKKIDPIEGIVGDLRDMYFRGVLVGVFFKFP